MLMSLFSKKKPETPQPQPVPQPNVTPTPQNFQPKPVEKAPEYTGPYFDINGKPDPLGKYTADKWQQAKELEELASKAVGKGPLSVTEITDEELAFLVYVNHNYRLSCNPIYALCWGPKLSMDELINRAETSFNHLDYDPMSYQGRMRGYVDAISTGALKPYWEL